VTEALNVSHADLLARVELFTALDRLALARLAASVDVVGIPAGAPVCSQGEGADALYVVFRGTCGVFVSSAAGHGETRLGTLTAGDYFGEMGLITGDPRSTSVRADADAEVLRLERDQFLELFRREPAVAETIIATLSRRLRGADVARLESGQAIAQNVEMALGRLPEGRRRRVLEASMLDTPSPAVLQTVFADDANEVATDLRELGATAGDLGAPIRSALKQRLESEAGAQRQRQFAHEAAARLVHAQCWEEALSLLARYGSGSDWLAALSQAVRAVPRLERGQAMAWVERISDEEASADPELALARAALYEERGDAAAAANVLRRALGGALVGNDSASAQRLTVEVARLAPDGALPGLGGLRYGISAGAPGARPPSGRTLLVIAAAAGLIGAGAFVAASQPGWAFLFFLVAAVVIRLDDTLPDFAVGFGLIALWILAGLAAPSVAVAGFASMEWLFVVAVLGLSAAIARSGFLLRVGLVVVRRMPPGLLWQAGGLLLTGILLSRSSHRTRGAPR